jgi:hypothetical protein
MPVLRLCARHRTLSPGRCPQCVSDRHERRRVHVSAKGKRFRRVILERDGFVCHWCGGEATSVDYLRALIDGGAPFDESNALAACLRCNSRRGAEITNRGGFSGGGISRALLLPLLLLQWGRLRETHDVEAHEVRADSAPPGRCRRVVPPVARAATHGSHRDRRDRRPVDVRSGQGGSRAGIDD